MTSSDFSLSAETREICMKYRKIMYNSHDFIDIPEEVDSLEYFRATTGHKVSILKNSFEQLNMFWMSLRLHKKMKDFLDIQFYKIWMQNKITFKSLQTKWKSIFLYNLYMRLSINDVINLELWWELRIWGR